MAFGTCVFHMPNYRWHMEPGHPICQMTYGIWKMICPYAKWRMSYGTCAFICQITYVAAVNLSMGRPCIKILTMPPPVIRVAVGSPPIIFVLSNVWESVILSPGTAGWRYCPRPTKVFTRKKILSGSSPDHFHVHSVCSYCSITRLACCKLSFHLAG